LLNYLHLRRSNVCRNYFFARYDIFIGGHVENTVFARCAVNAQFNDDDSIIYCTNCVWTVVQPEAGDLWSRPASRWYRCKCADDVTGSGPSSRSPIVWCAPVTSTAVSTRARHDLLLLLAILRHLQQSQ